MEQQWLLARKPLFTGDEYDSLVAKGKDTLESQLPGFKFEDEMRSVIQGADNKCEYYSPFEI